MGARIELSNKAAKDLRALRGNQDQPRVVAALDRLAEGAENLDIKALVGASPWLRLRVGDWRVLHRALVADELHPGEQKAYLIARVVNRRDLDAAVATLS